MKKAKEQNDVIYNFDYVDSDIERTYISHAKVVYNLYDVTITLGAIDDVADNKLKVVPSIKLVMSHRFFYQFADLMKTNSAALKDAIKDAIAQRHPQTVIRENAGGVRKRKP